MNNNILFSIIIPTYNRAHLISHTLESIRNQDFNNYELIIVDDGSTDYTKSIVENYINNYELYNFHYYHKTNEERGAARNFGISKANGEWITFLDSDDVFYSTHLSLAAEYILKNKEVIVFHSAYEFRNQENELSRKIIYPKNNNLNAAILKGNLFSCFGMFLKADVFRELKFATERLLSGSEDWLLWLQVAARYQIYLQSKISGCMIQHNERSVLGFDEEKLLSRTNFLTAKLKVDKVFIEKYGIRGVNKVYGHMLTYSALHILLSGNKIKSLRLFFKGLRYNPLELFEIRTLAFLKHLFLK